jgi:hypothetical protein
MQKLKSLSSLSAQKKKQKKNKASVDRKIFMDWFYNCFVREVEKYLPRNNSAFKVVPVLYSVLGHPATIQHAYPNIEVIFLPPNTTFLIQLLDQGIIATTHGSPHTYLI